MNTREKELANKELSIVKGSTTTEESGDVSALAIPLEGVLMWRVGIRDIDREIKYKGC